MRDTIECWRGVETIARAQLPSAAIEPDLLSAVPTGLRKEYLWLLRNSYMALTVTRWSRWCGLHPATLRRRSQLFAAPSPSLWLRLSRALHVAARLDLSPCKIAAIAADLAFSSAEALTMFMRRAVGAGATDLRSGGAIARVLDRAQTLFQLPSLAADATVLAPGTHISADGSVRCPLP